MTNYLTSACLSLDNMMNAIVMLLMFKHNEKCNRLCLRLCFFCCTKKIYKTKKNERIRVELKVQMDENEIKESEDESDSDLEKMWKDEDDEYDFIDSNIDTLAVIFLNENNVNHQFAASRVPTFV